MPFPSPTTEDPAQRFEESKDPARNALDEVVATANQAGWGTQEIAVALLEAAKSLKDANSADPDAADPPIGDAVKEQIGHGEQFD
ncbi:hypothetical protein B5P46_15355 [Rhizobium leguminosarum]|uniref:Uncharacterized protein n=1 Tax=Rhizobium leguminosarum TaxID=384 RepID=A0A4Q1U1Q5_RHILE|nr:hypothetical protein [Rhizobium leguminosarum]RXT25522.1 hypothetical protein B5P46_15355 [Rhizobium leguminosarum]